MYLLNQLSHFYHIVLQQILVQPTNNKKDDRIKSNKCYFRNKNKVGEKITNCKVQAVLAHIINSFIGKSLFGIEIYMDEVMSNKLNNQSSVTSNGRYFVKWDQDKINKLMKEYPDEKQIPVKQPKKLKKQNNKPQPEKLQIHTKQPKHQNNKLSFTKTQQVGSNQITHKINPETVNYNNDSSTPQTINNIPPKSTITNDNGCCQLI